MNALEREHVELLRKAIDLGDVEFLNLVSLGDQNFEETSLALHLSEVDLMTHFNTSDCCENGEKKEEVAVVMEVTRWWRGEAM